jgi:hypothetical protein
MPVFDEEGGLRRIKFFKPIKLGDCENCDAKNVPLDINDMCEKCSFRTCDMCGEMYVKEDKMRFWYSDEYGYICDKCRADNPWLAKSWYER